MLGICMKYWQKNYGAMLQAYAVLACLSKRGLEYEVIDYKKEFSPITTIRWIPRCLNPVWLNDRKEQLSRAFGRRKSDSYRENFSGRSHAFETFMQEYIHPISPQFHGYKELKKNASRYDSILVGSDQLWSPAALPTNFFNLEFVPDEVTKISFASSFGVSNIPWFQRRRTTHFLNRIDYLSVREARAAEIVKELTDRTVPVLLDPVFHLSKQEWTDAFDLSPIIDEPYLFAYFLGPDLNCREVTEEFARRQGIKLVVLRHLDNYNEYDENYGDFAPYNIGPKEFLSLLANASYVCTDSFHGSAFSIIFQKEFAIFNRYANDSIVSKNSRIDTLCNSLSVNNRRYCGDLDKVFAEAVDYESVSNLVFSHLAVNNAFLDEAFQGLSND